jgi:hypothetical protein
VATTEQAALKKAAQIIADRAKSIAARFSKRIPASITVTLRGMNASISAGGSEAPQAGMFETPRARHPLFGNDNFWYTQPYRPFLEEAAEQVGDQAMQEFADEVIKQELSKYRI